MEIALLGIRLVVGLAFAAHGAQKLFGAFGGDGITGTAYFSSSSAFAPAGSQAWAAGSTSSSEALGSRSASGRSSRRRPGSPGGPRPCSRSTWPMGSPSPTTDTSTTWCWSRPCSHSPRSGRGTGPSTAWSTSTWPARSRRWLRLALASSVGSAPSSAVASSPIGIQPTATATPRAKPPDPMATALRSGSGTGAANPATERAIRWTGVGTWSTYEAGHGEIVDLGGGRFYVPTWERGRGKGSGVEVEQIGADVFEAHDGRVVRMHGFGDRVEARAAAGLPPEMKGVVGEQPPLGLRGAPESTRCRLARGGAVAPCPGGVGAPFAGSPAGSRVLGNS